MLLVDGHNLIGRTPSLSLADEERGRELVLRRLGALGRPRREPVLVVFDGDRPGSAKETRFGGVRVVYAGAGQSADAEILRRLRRSNPRACTVVTSDRELALEAQALGARVESSDAFAARLRASGPPGTASEKPEPGTDDVDEWLALFGDSDRHKI